METFEIKTMHDAILYIRWLIDNNLQYHLDDNPKDIVWNTSKPTVEEIEMLQVNHDRLWAVCNPWSLFDDDDVLWNEYKGN